MSSRDEDDRDAILSRRQLLVAGALSGLAVGAVGARAVAQPARIPPCLSPMQQPLLGWFSPAPGRIDTAYEQIPEVVRHRLALHSIYAAGGGITSTPWRITLSLNGNLESGEGTEAGGPSHGALVHRWHARVPASTVQEIATLADQTWRERRAPNPHPTADYDEVLAMRDPTSAFFLQGFGPVREGAAARLIARLRAVATAARTPTP